MPTQLSMSFKAFLTAEHLEQDIKNTEAFVPMNLDSQNPAVHRLIKHSARRVIKQHQKEIQALKDK